MNKTLIFAATLNEYPNIRTFVKKIQILNLSVDLLIVDDNSSDGTLEFLKEFEKKNYFLRLVVRKKKLGLDTAHKFAFDYAIKNNYANLITLDADLSHEPELIPKFVEKLKKNYFVIGSRYMDGGSCDMKGFRLFLSIYGNIFIKKMLKINSTEFTTSYRGFDRKVLENLEKIKIKSTGYSFFMETIFQINRSNIEIAQIPIHFKDRISGKSKIPKIEIFRTFFNVFRLKFFDQI